MLLVSGRRYFLDVHAALPSLPAQQPLCCCTVLPALPGVMGWGARQVLAIPCPSLKNNCVYRDKIFWLVRSLQNQLFH